MPNTSKEFKISEKQQSSLNELKKKHEQNFSDFVLGLAIGRINDEYDKRKREDETEAEYKERLAQKAHEKDKQRDKERLNAWNNGLGSVTSTLTSTIDESLDKYLSAQQAMAAHLAGSSDTSLSSVLNKLQSTLSTSNIVRQENVFNNLGTLVRSGITYNVEQRAFLQTLANDIDMVFNAQDGSLTQLIRLQNRDLSSNRMAIEYSLQKFLNQNYQTSEYIKQGFESVSSSLLTAQSTMSAANAVNFEGTVQTWLGSMYSAGMNSSTIDSLAKALNQLGSGDISSLGQGISNLVLMGAARAGLDYGALLNNGLDAKTTDKLLASIASYMQEMGSNQSNVVRSQLGSLFGVGITDLIAANNMRATSGTVSSDIGGIGGLLREYGNYVTFGTGLKNTIANLMWSFGTNMATNSGTLLTYEITNMIAKSRIGDILYNFGEAINDTFGPAGTALQIAGIAASNASLIPIIYSMFSSGGFLSDVISSATQGSVADIFRALGSGAMNGGTVKISDAGVSGGMYISSTGINDLLSGSTSSLSGMTSQVVTIEDEGPTLEENVLTITDTVTQIFDLLTDRLESIDEAVSSLVITDNYASSSISAVNKGASF